MLGFIGFHRNPLWELAGRLAASKLTSRNSDTIAPRVIVRMLRHYYTYKPWKSHDDTMKIIMVISWNYHVYTYMKIPPKFNISWLMILESNTMKLPWKYLGLWKYYEIGCMKMPWNISWGMKMPWNFSWGNTHIFHGVIPWKCHETFHGVIPMILFMGLYPW